MPARPLRRLAVAAAAATAVLFALPVAAGAHVGAAGQTVDGVTTVTFTFHHGCEGAATTGLRVQLPEGVTDVEPQDPAGWTSEVSGDELTWSGGSIADGADGLFVATMKLSDPEGTTVFLPTIQQCGDAQEAWIDKSDDPEADAAAPRITAGALVATTGHESEDDGHGSASTGANPEATTNAPTGAAPESTTTADDHGDSDTASSATENASHSSSSNAPLIIAIVAAVVIIGALIAFFVTRRGSSSGAA